MYLVISAPHNRNGGIRIGKNVKKKTETKIKNGMIENMYTFLSINLLTLFFLLS